jgi:1-deoxy-D-xylulose-5-phosphate reductoisomerase
MGPKITIDSATMMNKALEIVEAHHLFDIPAERIQVTIHPQSIVHSLVVFRDGSVLAQMGVPDMRTPLQVAMTWPERLPGPGVGFDPVAFSGLTFAEPDLERFPSLRMGFEVARRGRLSGAVLNAANERAVELFLKGAIPFPAIFSLVDQVLSRHGDGEITDLESVLDADRWAREEVLQCL